MNEQAWMDLEADKERRLPTPPIGTPVQWYQGGNKDNCYAGRVTGIEGPGRIKVEVAVINSFPAHKRACYHVSHRIHERPNSTTESGGSWDYLPYTKVPKEHYDLHNAELDRREANLLGMEEKARQNEALFAQKQAEKEASRGKIKSPMPLPAPV